MDHSKFDQWVKKIMATEKEEISCSECFDLISGYVDHELSGETTGMVMSQVAKHLKQCPACQQEYEVLLDLAMQEASGRSSSPNDLKK